MHQTFSELFHLKQICTLMEVFSVGMLYHTIFLLTCLKIIKQMKITLKETELTRKTMYQSLGRKQGIVAPAAVAVVTAT